MGISITGNIRPRGTFKWGKFRERFVEYWDNVVLLIRPDGSHGSTSLTDLSSRGHTLTFAGNAHVSTTQKYFGDASIRSDASSNSGVYTDLHSDFVMGTGDFTVELWYYPVSKVRQYPRVFQFGPGNVNWNASGCYAFCDRHDYAASVFSLQAYEVSGNTLILKSTTTVQNNQWYHLALVRQNTTLMLFVNGNLEDTYTTSSSIDSRSSNRFQIGAAGLLDSYTNDEANGYWDEIRITKGVARYTESFTPPTEPFPVG